MLAPIIGPITGIHEYDQSLDPFPEIGSILCMILGPRSRTGLIAYPVVPPSDSPIAQTRNITGIAPKDPSPTGVLVSTISAVVK